MTYFGFLARFLVIPILILVALLVIDARRGKSLPQTLRGWSPWAMLGILIGIALIYTTPWDNYLVATGVWFYDPARVTGITLGWVPLEEYVFFILQPILVGLWALWLARRLRPAPLDDERIVGNVYVRVLIPLVTFWVWVVSVVILLVGWKPGTYLGLELAWALPPILLQLIFGLDTLIRQRRLVLLTIIPMTLYLSAMDALAIGEGVWTIHPQQSTGIMIGGILPVEELIFFLLTTTLVTLGLVLGIATRSQRTLQTIRSSRLVSRVFQIASFN